MWLRLRPRRRAGRGKAEDKEWIPVTKLGRLVKDMKIKSVEKIYLFSLPIKESEIIDFFFLGASLKDEVPKIMPGQKQTRAAQQTRFKAFVATGDYNGHVGLSVKCPKEVASASARGSWNGCFINYTSTQSHRFLWEISESHIFVVSSLRLFKMAYQTTLCQAIFRTQ